MKKNEKKRNTAEVNDVGPARENKKKKKQNVAE